MASSSRDKGRPDSQTQLPFDRQPSAQKEDTVAVRCRACRKTLRIPRWVSEQGLSLHFCDEGCRKQWERDSVAQTPGVSLSGRPSFRGGNWEDIAARVRKRDGYRCCHCGRSEEELGRQLDVHHVLPFRMFKTAREANRLKNLVSACPSCHKAEEQKGREQFPLFGDGTELRI